MCIVRKRSQWQADQLSRGILLNVVYLTECEHEALTVRRPGPNSGCRNVIVQQLSGTLFINMSL